MTASLPSVNNGMTEPILCIRPGVIVVYERNYVTNELFKKRGIEVIEIPSSELSRGRGGPRCMSMPLVRANLKLFKHLSYNRL